jgi:acyl-CoA synthetase (AMP-forming)/AMP-acid ligase II
MLTTELIERGARNFAAETAVLYGDQSMTFADVDTLANRIANALVSAAKADHGCRIGLLLTNSLFSLPVDFACAKARLVRVPLNARLSGPEHANMLTGAGVTVLVHGEDLADRARELRELLPGLALYGLGPVTAGQDLLSLARNAADTPPGRRPEPDDPVLALYTSGTTGKLKAAVHTQASWAAIGLNILLNLVDVRRGEAMLHAASLIHASGTFVLPYWSRGGRAAVLPGFQPQAYLHAIETWRPAALNLVPTMLGMLLEQPGIETADFSAVQTITYGASPMPRPTIERALQLWGPRFVQYYGQTEAPLAIAVLTKEDHVGENAHERRLACGRPSLDCEVRIIDETGADLAAGQPGEIAVRAPFGMTGYLDAPELNASTMLPGGWIKTRDIGRFDDAGYLYLVDRTSDMIITGGYNVYPREVEDVLAEHRFVREVAVVGIPDDKWGEAVTAFVALRAQHIGENAVEEDIIAFARARLAGYKVPKSVRVVDEIPKSAVGKLLRRALRDPFWAGRERRL